jgi:poly(3-hydroxybutyrate) depolymerase
MSPSSAILFKLLLLMNFLQGSTATQKSALRSDGGGSNKAQTAFLGAAYDRLARVTLPATYEKEAGRMWPLVIVLHGFNSSGRPPRSARRHPRLVLVACVHASIYATPSTRVPRLVCIIIQHLGAVVAGEYHDLYLGVSSRASRLGFIAVVPNGTANAQGQRFWNAQGCCDFEVSSVWLYDWTQ